MVRGNSFVKSAFPPLRGGDPYQRFDPLERSCYIIVGTEDETANYPDVRRVGEDDRRAICRWPVHPSSADPGQLSATTANTSAMERPSCSSSSTCFDLASRGMVPRPGFE